MAAIKERTGIDEQPREKPGQISMLNEVRRKLIHLSSLGVPVIYWFISRQTALMILIVMTVVAVAIEVLRRFFPGFEIRFRRIFGLLLRPHETGVHPQVNGATYVLVSACLCVAIFPKIIAITSFAGLIISDSASALYGRRFGKRKFLKKSVEGSMAFLLTAFVAVAIVAYLSGATWEFMVVGAVASVVGMVVEALSEGGSSIDDNLTIPTSFGAVLWIGLILIERRDLLQLL